MLFKLKLWALNLKRMDEVEGTPFGKLMEEWNADGFGLSFADQYDYYKIFHNDPEYHMMYSTSYLQATPLFKLILKHNSYRDMYRRMYLRELDAHD